MDSAYSGNVKICLFEATKLDNKVNHKSRVKMATKYGFMSRTDTDPKMLPSNFRQQIILRMDSLLSLSLVQSLAKINRLKHTCNKA